MPAKNKIRKFSLFLIFLLIIFLCLSSCKRSERYVPEIGRPFTDFELKDIEGNDISTTKLKGKVLIVEFWATWCEPCRLTIPELISIYAKYGDKGVEIIAISIDEGMDDKRMKDFVREYRIPYRVAIANKRIKDKFKIYTVPTTFVVNKEGIIVNIYRGYIPQMEELFEREIERLI